MKLEHYLNIFVLIIASFCLVSWAINPAWFLILDTVPMNPFTAVCLVLNLCSFYFDNSNANKLFVHTSMILATLILCDFFFVESLKLDTWLFTDKLAVLDNRMAPSTAIGLLMMCASRLNFVCNFPVFSFAGLGLTACALLIRVCNFTTLAGIALFTPMSVWTAIALAACYTSQILTWRHYCKICCKNSLV